MPSWKKVIISGSDASLNTLTVTNGITGSLFGTSSWSENAVTASYVLNSISSSYSATASYLNTLNQDLTFNGNLTLNGTASINYLNVIYETASVIYSSGSNQFGDATNDTQTLIGTVKVSGSLQVTGSTTTTGDVGIATNSPRYRLDVSGSGNFTNTLTVTGSILVTQSYISTVDYIDFTTTVNPAYLEGRIHWLEDTKTLNLDSDVNGFSVEVGHQSVVRVNNQTGNVLTKGTIVYINGESGNRPTVATASWVGDSTSAGTLGWIAQDINNNQNGYVVTDGILRGINTTAYAPGTQLYLSSSGQYTSTIPISPLHEVRLGKTITQAVDGYVYVDIMNGYEIGELHDVLITSASTGDLLMWDSGSRVWYNTKSLTGSYTISGSLQLTGSYSITGSTKLNGSLTTKTYRLTSASYTASVSDYRIGVRYTDTGSVAIQLPLISQVGEIEYRFKDEEGNAQTNPITLYASGSDLIDGSATAILQRNYIAISLYNDGTSNWYIE